MKLIMFTVSTMLLLMLVGQAYQMSVIVEPDDYSYSMANQNSSYVVSGSEEFLELTGQTFILGISLADGVLISIIGLGALIFGIGIKVLDSGLSETTQRGLVNIAVFMAFWGIFSVLTYELIIDIPVFGWFIYLIITIIHLLGIMQIYNGGSE